MIYFKDAGKGGKEPAKEEEKHDKSKGKKDDKGAAKKGTVSSSFSKIGMDTVQ